MRRGLELDGKWKSAAPDCGQQFFAGLDGSFCPAMLLRFKPIHVHWELSGRYNISQVNEFPAHELGAIAQIEILRERVMLPATGFRDAGTSPETGGSIEIEKSAASAALNCAEGAARQTRADKSRAYGIALCECCEACAAIEIAGFTPIAPTAEVTTLSGKLGDINPPDSPAQIHSIRTTFDKAAEHFEYEFPAYSYTILKLKRKE